MHLILTSGNIYKSVAFYYYNGLLSILFHLKNNQLFTMYLPTFQFPRLEQFHKMLYFLFEEFVFFYWFVKMRNLSLDLVRIIAWNVYSLQSKLTISVRSILMQAAEHRIQKCCMDMPWCKAYNVQWSSSSV